MSTAKEEWVSFDTELKTNGEVVSDPLNEVSLEEDKPLPPPRSVTPEVNVAQISVSKEEQAPPRRSSVDAGIKSGDVEQRPISMDILLRR